MMVETTDTKEKRPRHYAFELLEIPTAAERRAYLQSVPEHFRSLVKSQFISLWMKRKLRNDMK